MCSYRSHQQSLLRMLKMLEKGRLLSRRQATQLFGCTEGTITAWLNELREDGYNVHYSRSLQKYVLQKKETDGKK
ncbi:MAG: hypothetical protein WKF68_05355 [Daejeonella sp.]